MPDDIHRDPTIPTLYLDDVWGHVEGTPRASLNGGAAAAGGRDDGDDADCGGKFLLCADATWVDPVTGLTPLDRLWRRVHEVARNGSLPCVAAKVTVLSGALMDGGVPAAAHEAALEAGRLAWRSAAAGGSSSSSGALVPSPVPTGARLVAARRAYLETLRLRAGGRLPNWSPDPSRPGGTAGCVMVYARDWADPYDVMRVGAAVQQLTGYGSLRKIYFKRDEETMAGIYSSAAGAQRAGFAAAAADGYAYGGGAQGPRSAAGGWRMVSFYTYQNGRLYKTPECVETAAEKKKKKKRKGKKEAAASGGGRSSEEEDYEDEECAGGERLVCELDAEEVALVSKWDPPPEVRAAHERYKAYLEEKKAATAAMRAALRPAAAAGGRRKRGRQQQQQWQEGEADDPIEAWLRRAAGGGGGGGGGGGAGGPSPAALLQAALAAASAGVGAAPPGWAAIGGFDEQGGGDEGDDELGGRDNEEEEEYLQQEEGAFVVTSFGGAKARAEAEAAASRPWPDQPGRRLGGDGGGASGGGAAGGVPPSLEAVREARLRSLEQQQKPPPQQKPQAARRRSGGGGAGRVSPPRRFEGTIVLSD
jgi:hypothetical protein